MKYNSIIIVGPTASGKTALSLYLAKKFNGEIVSADSMQIYKDFNIGTAKATAEEQSVAKHHMIDILDMNDSFSVSEYKKMALECCDSILADNKTPIIVGGTGFYVKSLLYDYDYGNSEKSTAIRQELQQALEEKGKTYLHSMLSDIDEESAKLLHENDTKRVIRAIEIYRLTGKKKSDQTPNTANNNLKPIIFGLDIDREKLYERINLRVDIMIKSGLIEEIKSLIDNGADVNSQAFSSIGYKEFIPYLNNEITLSEAIEQVKLNTRHYAKRQLTFFRAMENIKWIDMTNGLTDEVKSKIDELLK